MERDGTRTVHTGIAQRESLWDHLQAESSDSLQPVIAGDLVEGSGVFFLGHGH